MSQDRRTVLPLVVATHWYYSRAPGIASPVAAVFVPADPSCSVITVDSSSEKAALLREIASSYNAGRRTVDGGCAQVTVESGASGDVEAALARGWNVSSDGPLPDVWTPAASAWLVLLREQLQGRDKAAPVPTSTPSIAQTPLVIAMPRVMAQALGWPTKQLGWSDLFALARDPRGWGSVGHPEWGRFTLGKTNPHVSTSGLNATIATFFAATGVSSDLTVADVRQRSTQDFVRQIESSVVHYGDTTLTFLSNLAKADRAGRGLSYVSAVTVEEKSVWDYNQGNPSGDPGTLGKQPPPRVPLVALYPKDGTLVSDSPYAVLQEPWVDQTKRDVAADFLAFVRSPSEQQVLQAAGFRSYDGTPGAAINEANGLSAAGPPLVLAPPSPSVLQAVSDSWDLLRRRARVLLVMDVSGSMSDNVGDSGTSKIELARQAALQAITGLAPDDEVGLWEFSSNIEGRVYKPLVAVGPDSVTAPRMRAAIRAMTTWNGTALYATLREAQKQMTASYDPTRINAVVVLTDGKNEYNADNDLSGLVAGLSSAGADKPVRIFTIGYGSDADAAALTQIADATHAAYYSAADPTGIHKVLVSVLSNF